MPSNPNARDCTGHAKATDAPCRAFAMRGTRACSVHGGRRPDLTAAELDRRETALRAEDHAARLALADRLAARSPDPAAPMQLVAQLLEQGAA